ncbi:hypothetical protein BS78_03G000300 [Paspalum vaginatum]|nr:hypothetical protein BS78_03G000300 [Paspalum vaginatum]
MAAKEALVKLIVMFPEAARFNTVREVFSPGGLWQQVTYLSPRECALLVKWGKLSALTLKSHRTRGTWGGDDLQAAADQVGGEPLHIQSAQQALQDLDFLVRPP